MNNFPAWLKGAGCRRTTALPEQLLRKLRMLIGVVTTGSPTMGYTAMVPDLPACLATDPDMERVLTRIHLVLEGFFSDRLIAGDELPVARSTLELQDLPEFAGARLFDIHINLVHLSAVAKHQARERKAVE
jgi:hypothetical protein